MKLVLRDTNNITPTSAILVVFGEQNEVCPRQSHRGKTNIKGSLAKAMKARSLPPSRRTGGSSRSPPLRGDAQVAPAAAEILDDVR